MKEYKTMSKEEQAQWVVQFSEFLANDYANVKAMGEGWSEAFERGLKVLEPFTICDRFVGAARVYHDYERRVQRMAFFVEELRKQVIAVDGSLLAQAVAPQKRRVGRPTKKEQMAMQQERVLKDSGKMDAVMQIAGMSDEGARGKEQGTRERGEMAAMVSQQSGLMGDLFNDNPNLNPNLNDNDNLNDNLNDNADDDGGEPEMAGRLQDVKRLLMGDLQEEVDKVAMYRSERAMASERAKEEALKGSSQEVVAKYAQEAAEKEEKVQRIYRMVDENLAMVYISARLWKEEVVAGEKREDVLKETEYYYRKVVAKDKTFEGRYLAKLAGVEGREKGQGARSEGREEGQEELLQGISDKERKKRIKYARDYFMRKARPSEGRLKKMREKIDEVKMLGGNVEDLELVFRKEEEDLRVKG